MLQNTALRITPDNSKTHISLEQEVCEYLISKGFKAYALPYHEVLDSGVVKLLSSRYDPTSLYLRARADRFAIHINKSIQFEFDLKTHENSRYKDMTLELYPAILHLRKSTIGVKCLYCYRDPYTGTDCGFWFNDFPPIRQVTIPNARRMVHLRKWFESMANYYFPNKPIYKPDYRQNGSGDPYVIINHSEVVKLRHWKELIDETLL